MPDYKTNPVNSLTQDNNKALISWTNSLAIGIELIDDQHKHLVELTNELFKACRLGGDALDAAFKKAMSSTVDYVRFHFTIEQQMLERIKYPAYVQHKKEHDDFIKNILDATKDYADKSKRFVPNNFVRFLKDWIVGHIGHSDKVYAAYIADQIKKGFLDANKIFI